jgi:hypothetical protein
VVTQALLIRCPHCHIRPGLWIFAIWTLLLDLEIYVADVMFLRECPKCERPLLLVPTETITRTT